MSMMTHAIMQISTILKSEPRFAFPSCSSLKPGRKFWAEGTCLLLPKTQTKAQEFLAPVRK